MEGISKKRLEEIAEDYPPDHRNHRMAKYLIATECQELQEPWMPIDEFLKSGFRGVCFVFTEPYTILCERTNCGFFAYNSNLVDISAITDVMPIHKPEQPR